MLEAPIMVSSGSSDLPLQLNPWEAQALNVSHPVLSRVALVLNADGTRD